MGKTLDAAREVADAFANMIKILATPREKRADELAAEEFCAKMRGMGADPTQGLQHAAMLTALGASDGQVSTLCGILARGRITTQDAHQLRWHGIEVDAEAQA